MTTIKRILCPTDYSEPSHHAFEHALTVARWCKAPVSVLHVDPHPGDAEPDRLRSEQHRPDGSAQLREKTAAWVEGASPQDVAVDVLLRTGLPVREILEVATSLPADMIVMGTHGASGFEHLVLGSVTEKVLRKAGCPVMTVPPRAHATSALPFKQLLCAMDFSVGSVSALELALSLAQESQSSLTLLHVVEWPWEEPPAPVLEELPPEQANALMEFRRSVTQRAMQRLNGLVPETARARCRIVPQVVHGRSYAQILRVAAEGRADLIVMGVHGRSAVDLLLFGSTTNQVVRRATCPVLTLRH